MPSSLALATWPSMVDVSFRLPIVSVPLPYVLMTSAGTARHDNMKATQASCENARRARLGHGRARVGAGERGRQHMGKKKRQQRRRRARLARPGALTRPLAALEKHRHARAELGEVAAVALAARVEPAEARAAVAARARRVQREEGARVRGRARGRVGGVQQQLVLQRRLDGRLLVAAARRRGGDGRGAAAAAAAAAGGGGGAGRREARAGAGDADAMHRVVERNGLRHGGPRRASASARGPKSM